ncbi:MAG: amidohydrolase, partial [Clostridium sp.]
INIGVHIHLALQELLSREVSPLESVVLTFGKFTGGDAANIIPASLVMEGTLRTFNEKLRTHLLERINEICECTAKAFRGSAVAEIKGSTCSLQIDSKTADIIAEGWKKEEGLTTVLSEYKMSGSEDFAEIAKLVPSSFFVLGGGTATDGCHVGLHNPAIVLSEASLPYGAAAYASGAAAWLQAYFCN